MGQSPSVADLLYRLTALSQELAGTFRPATIVELVARALSEQLAPERLSIMLLDTDTNRLVVAYHNGPRPATTDEPLLQLALRRGPLVFPDRVAERAAEVEVTLSAGAPALEGERAGALDDAALTFVRAALAQASIALENARLVELLSSGKREWEETVDAINQAICYVAPDGSI